MTWGRFERFALDGYEGKNIYLMVWPMFIAELVYLVAAPIRDWLIYHRFMR